MIFIFNYTTQFSSTDYPADIYYYIFEMENFAGSPRGTKNKQFTSQQHEGMEKILFRLKELHQIQDQSRNQLCPIFLDEESQSKSRRQQRWSQHQVSTQVNILKQLQQEGCNDKQERYLPTTHSGRGPYNSAHDNHLRQSNIKLTEDNVKLFKECIRLKKLCQQLQKQNGSFRKKSVNDDIQIKLTELQRQNNRMKKEVQDLKRQKQNLKDKLNGMTYQLSSNSLTINKCNRLTSQVYELERLNTNLTSKIQNLERELESYTSRQSSKSSQSGSANNSTQQSRRTQVEKDRMITNMKIVHESQTRKLKNMIEQLKRELGRDDHNNFSSAVNLRKK